MSKLSGVSRYDLLMGRLRSAACSRRGAPSSTVTRPVTPGHRAPGRHCQCQPLNRRLSLSRAARFQPRPGPVAQASHGSTVAAVTVALAGRRLSPGPGPVRLALAGSEAHWQAGTGMARWHRARSTLWSTSLSLISKLSAGFPNPAAYNSVTQ